MIAPGQTLPEGMISVLLADDHIAVRAGLRDLVGSQIDMRVVGEAADGLTAVAMAAQLLPDVAVLDIAMPGLGGIEATRKIRASCPATRIVIFSIHCTREHIERALDAGAAGYVAKTGATGEVVRAIRAVHQGAQYLNSGPFAGAAG